VIEYSLEDADGNSLALNGTGNGFTVSGSWTQGSDDFDIETLVSERSVGPGAVQIGDPRVRSRSISMMVVAADPDGVQEEVNTLLAFFQKTKYLVDDTDGQRLRVVPKGIGVEHAQGSLKLVSDVTLNFLAINPFWEATTETTLTGTIPADTLTGVAVSNGGFAKAPATITLEVSSVAVPSIQIYKDSNNEGILVEDDGFGVGGNDTLVIDNDEGTVMLGDADRNQNIADGTGFFCLEVGSDTLQFLVADNDVDYTITYRERFFI